MKSKVKTTDRGLQITRIFDAPRSEVFGWWADAGKLRQWSACKDATSCEVVMDFRVGGSFTQRMQIAVNGNTCEFSFTGTYEEIAVPEKLSYRADLGQSKTHVTVEFFDHGDGTKIVLTQDGLSEPCACTSVSQGTQESFDKLASILSEIGVLSGISLETEGT